MQRDILAMSVVMHSRMLLMSFQGNPMTLLQLLAMMKIMLFQTMQGNLLIQMQWRLTTSLLLWFSLLALLHLAIMERSA